jgi:hypothetical protein
MAGCDVNISSVSSTFVVCSRKRKGLQVLQLQLGVADPGTTEGLQLSPLPSISLATKTCKGHGGSERDTIWGGTYGERDTIWGGTHGERDTIWSGTYGERLRVVLTH